LPINLFRNLNSRRQIVLWDLNLQGLLEMGTTLN